MMKMHKYANRKKQAARTAIWRVLAPYFIEHAAAGGALMFPGPIRSEFDTAVRCGIPPTQLHLIEYEERVKRQFNKCFKPNERKLFRWQKGLLSDACRNLSFLGEKILVAHIDFCKPLGFYGPGKPAVEIEKFIKSNVMVEGLLAITILGAREQDGTHDDAVRYKRMMKAIKRGLRSVGIPRTVTLVKDGWYWNDSKDSCNPMLWGIFQLEKTP
jgi:hypothetical protein